jgi:GPH family glycoside/pentoside/hexuronide:cation symporter
MSRDAQSGGRKGGARLSRLQIGAYSLAVWPLVVGQMPLGFMTAYYTQVLGLNLALVGGLMMSGRIFDAFADMAVAYGSDSLPTRFGRRRPWVILGLALFIPTLWLLFVPYPSMTMLRYGIAVFLFFLTWTVAFVPYLSQGTELSTDHEERGRINITQSITMLFGFFAGYILPFVLVDKRTFPFRSAVGNALAGLRLPFLDPLAAALRHAPLTGVASYGETILVVVITCSIIGPIALAGYALFVPDRSTEKNRAKGSMIHAFRNPVFQRFCGGYFLIMTGYLGRTGLFPFILAFWFHRADLLLALVLAQNVTSICVTPIWAMLFKRLERRTCIALAAMIEVAALLFLIVMPNTSDGLLILAYVIIGLPGQTLLMCSYLVAADSADYAYWKHGTESRAVHVSIISLIVKWGNIAAAATVVIAASLGFDPKIGAQPLAMVNILKIVGLFLPVLFLLAGAAVVMTYPITRRRQTAIQRRLDRRRDAAVQAAAATGLAMGPLAEASAPEQRFVVLEEPAG